MLKAIVILSFVAASTASILPGALLRKEVGAFIAPKSNNIEPFGIVQPAHRCGGVGTPLQLRISECEGRCEFIPGRVYHCEKDFVPSSAAASLTLRIEICMPQVGFCTIILETELPNSSVQPGNIYTATYSIVPNDILSGETVEFRGYLFNTASMLMEICVSAEIVIL